MAEPGGARVPADPERPILADTRGATVWFSREDWGVVIDALIEHTASAQRRKAGNSESTSDVRVEACGRMIGALTSALSNPTPLSAARTPDPERLAEAERELRGHVEWPGYSVVACDDLALVLAEYDRRGAVEKAAAAHVLAGLCGDFEIPDDGAAHREKLAALIAAVRTNGEFRG